MLAPELKKTIQSQYSLFLQNRKLKPRHGQKLMIAHIANFLDEINVQDSKASVDKSLPVCVIEAGTGTGKTLAYLISVLPVARELGKKVIISTATVALQEQVVQKDIPDLLDNTEMKFSFALAKGKARYLCLSKLDNVLRGSSSQQAMLDLYGIDVQKQEKNDTELYNSMLDSLARQNWNGDRDEWPDVIEDFQWASVAVENGQCSGSRCSHFSNCCFFQQRRHMEEVDCIVANHDLVLSDLELGGGVILPDPADTIYVFDEGHHLPDKGVSRFAHNIRLRVTARWLDQVNQVMQALVRELPASDIHKQLEAVQDKAGVLRVLLNEALAVFMTYAESAVPENRQDRSLFTFAGGLIDIDLREFCNRLQAASAELADKLDEVLEFLKKGLDGDNSQVDRSVAENWYPLVGGMQGRAQSIAACWKVFCQQDKAGEAPTARWIQYHGDSGEQEINVSCSPVLAARALENHLWFDCFAAILTSATMTALGTFDYLAMRAGLDASARYHRISSPFDFQHVGRLELPLTAFNPAENATHTDNVARFINQLDRSKGILILFSSRRQMQDVIQRLDPEVSSLVLCQDDHPKQVLIREHKARVDRGECSIILGLASFAEGIDLPGNYCVHVVIAKIPFSVPNDPVGQTLGEWVRAGGKNPFLEISVPEASMRLIQASGRLLRHEKDQGTITILDDRLINKPYGRELLMSLPPYKVERKKLL